MSRLDADVLAYFRQKQIDPQSIREYEPPGPVADAYLLDRKHSVRFIKGPIGSGKTNANFFDKLAIAHDMPKCTRGGEKVVGNRLFRHLEIRDTYANLWSTTIPSWWAWFGPDVGNWSGGIGRKATHNLTFDMPDGGLLFFEIVFQAIQEADVDAALRGIEFTTANMGEADMQAPDVLPYLIGRALQQRYPPKRFFEPGTSYYTGVTGDLNPPDPENWIYDVFVEKKPHGHKLYEQPSGRSPQGENRTAISREIYEEMARTNAHRPWWVRRMVDGQWGFSREGEPVYEEYDDLVHCADTDLAPVAGLPVRLGFDQGVTGPAMLVLQWLPNGQLRVLDELCPGRIGPTGFGRLCRVLLDTRYRGIPVERATGDLAGFTGGDQEFGDQHFFDTVANTMNLVITPAETNEINLRLDGVRQLLRYRVDGKQPGLLISPRCKKLRKGFNSLYRYRKRRGTENVTEPKPEKGEYSNPHDALQYGVMDLMGLEAVKRGMLMGAQGDRFGQGMDDDDDAGAVMANTSFDVWNT